MGLIQNEIEKKLKDNPAEWLAYKMIMPQGEFPETGGDAIDIVKKHAKTAIVSATEALQAKYDTLKQSHEKLVEACKSFLKFADTDLPKGLILELPEDWLDELRCNSNAIRWAVQALAEAMEIEK